MLSILTIFNFEKYTIITNSALWLILIWICKAWKRLSQCSPSSFFKRLKMHHNLCPCCSLSLKTTTTIPWRLGFPKSSVKTISFVFMSVTDNSKLTQNTIYVIVHFEKHSIKVESPNKLLKDVRTLSVNDFRFASIHSHCSKVKMKGKK